MTGSARTFGLVTSFAGALMLAATLVWAASAESKPQDGMANLQILGVNDFHGNLEPARRSSSNPTIYGGAAILDAYLERETAENRKGTIRVHAGDMVGASPLISSYFHDEPTVYAMNNMGFDIGTLGNHEFDEGGEEMLRLLRGGRRDDGEQFKDGPDGEPVNTSARGFPGADFPYVSANTVYDDSGENVLQPYRILERKGVKVGFIGVTTEDTPNIVTPDEIAPFRFLDISDTVNRYTAELRGQGVETIVVLAHEGGFLASDPNAVPPASGEILEEVKEMSADVDVVVAGHTHTKLDNCVADYDGRVTNETNGCGQDKLVVESYAFGTAFDQVQMQIDRGTGDVVNATAEVVDTVRTGIKRDKKTQAIVDRYAEKIEPIASRVVSTAETDISRTDNPDGESSLGALIADAQRAYPADQGAAPADFAFMNPGGIRQDITQGEVTYGELFAVQPFDNQVVTMDLTGAQIYTLLDQQFPPNQSGTTVRILQVSGLTYTYDSSQPQGQRITELEETDGTPISNDDTTTYRVAVNSFIASGGDSFTVLTEGENVETIGSDLDALEAYIDDEPTFAAPDDALTRITNATPANP